MPAMDDTQVRELLAELAHADPADAPDVAEQLARLLADRLEADEEPTA